MAWKLDWRVVSPPDAPHKVYNSYDLIMSETKGNRSALRARGHYHIHKMLNCRDANSWNLSFSFVDERGCLHEHSLHIGEFKSVSECKKAAQEDSISRGGTPVYHPYGWPDE